MREQRLGFNPRSRHLDVSVPLSWASAAPSRAAAPRASYARRAAWRRAAHFFPDIHGTRRFYLWSSQTSLEDKMPSMMMHRAGAIAQLTRADHQVGGRHSASTSGVVSAARTVVTTMPDAIGPVSTSNWRDIR